MAALIFWLIQANVASGPGLGWQLLALSLARVGLA